MHGIGILEMAHQTLLCKILLTKKGLYLMDKVTRKLIQKYVNGNIDSFHVSRIGRLKKLTLNQVLKQKNPYLFRAKNITLASDLIPARSAHRIANGARCILTPHFEVGPRSMAPLNGRICLHRHGPHCRF